MVDLHAAVLAASTAKSIGAVIAAITLIGFVWYAVVNIRAGRAEVGSEIELAPNRKPYFDDEELEGPQLTRVLSTGLLLLGVLAVGLPLYWLNEPGRQDGAVEMYDNTFVKRGAALFAPTAEGGYDCAGCHGAEGVGGLTNFTLTDENNDFVAQVSWRAPALNTVFLRFSEDEVREILVYGRPGTPMPAWGAEGGGALTTQQIDELIAYLRTIQISPEEAQAQAEDILRSELGLQDGERINYNDPAVGEALFNLGLKSGAAGGAFSCARCHTKGASIIDGSEQPAGADLSAHKGFETGSGAFGFNLTDGVVPRQFLTIDDLIEFLTKGSEYGMLYGQRGMGTGRMPGYGDNPNTEAEGDGMWTPEMIEAVARYEASLGTGSISSDEETGNPVTTTTVGSTGANAPTTSTTEEP